MAGYSQTLLPKKLGIVAGSKIAVVKAPKEYPKALGKLPSGAKVSSQARGVKDVVLFFATRQRELERRFPSFAHAVFPAGGLWIAWPKKTSGVCSDLDENVVRSIGLDCGLVDNKVCAIDEIWSGLRFVYRSADRVVK